MRDFINLDRYPFHQASPARDAVVARVHADLAVDGCAVLKPFLTPTGAEALRVEADSVAHLGHRSFNRTNAFFTADDPRER